MAYIEAFIYCIAVVHFKVSPWNNNSTTSISLASSQALFDYQGAVGAVQRVKLNPYQTMLSGYDANHDGKIASSDAVYNYMYSNVNADGSITLYLPDNAAAKEIQINLDDLKIANSLDFNKREVA